MIWFVGLGCYVLGGFVGVAVMMILGCAGGKEKGETDEG